jgi:hypothetical protein
LQIPLHTLLSPPPPPPPCPPPPPLTLASSMLASFRTVSRFSLSFFISCNIGYVSSYGKRPNAALWEAYTAVWSGIGNVCVTHVVFVAGVGQVQARDADGRTDVSRTLSQQTRTCAERAEVLGKQVRCLRGGPDRRTHLTPARPGTPGSASRLLGSGLLLTVAASATRPAERAHLAYAATDRRARAASHRGPARRAARRG